MRRVMLLRVRGGLCNRLQGLLTGAVWAEWADRSLRVAWPVNKYFGADLSDLFGHSFRLISPQIVKVAARACGGYHTHLEVRGDDNRKILVAVSGKHFIIDGAPIGLSAPLKALQPVDQIAARVIDTAQWDRPVVGVMIRGNDLAHEKTLEASPLSWFLQRMTEIRKDDPEIPFFLSTDSPTASRAIHSAFSGVVELQGKSPYNTLGGVQDAVADLYLLASTTYVLGSAVSSFSHTAGLLADHGGYETSQDPPADSWSTRRDRTVTCILR